MKKLVIMVVAIMTIMSLSACHEVTWEVVETEVITVKEETKESEYAFNYEVDLSSREDLYEAFVREFLKARLGYEPESADITVRVDGSKDGPVEWFTIRTERLVYDVKYGSIDCYAVMLG